VATYRSSLESIELLLENTPREVSAGYKYRYMYRQRPSSA
jgi:hypothetical protein